MNQNYYVFDRMDENSLLAAAVLKHSAPLQVMDLEQVERLQFGPEDTLYWLGVEAPFDITRQIRCNHVCLIPNQHKKLSVLPHVEVITGDYSSITHLVVEEILVRRLRANPEAIELARQWNTVGSAVSHFQDLTATMELVAYAHGFIRMAFEYLYFNRAFGIHLLGHDMWREEKDYMEAVKETKHMLDQNVQSHFRLKDGKFIGERILNVTDYHWYLAKRMLSLAGQVWAAPRIIDHVVQYRSSERQLLVA